LIFFEALVMSPMKTLVSIDWFALTVIAILSKYNVVADYKVYFPAIKLSPTNDLVRYTEGFLNAPDENNRGIALIDLRDLKFTPANDGKRILLTDHNVERSLMQPDEPVDSEALDIDILNNATEAKTSTPTMTVPSDDMLFDPDVMDTSQTQDPLRPFESTYPTVDPSFEDPEDTDSSSLTMEPILDDDDFDDVDENYNDDDDVDDDDVDDDDVDDDDVDDDDVDDDDFDDDEVDDDDVDDDDVDENYNDDDDVDFDDNYEDDVDFDDAFDDIMDPEDTYFPSLTMEPILDDDTMDPNFPPTVFINSPTKATAKVAETEDTKDAKGTKTTETNKANHGSTVGKVSSSHAQSNIDRSKLKNTIIDIAVFTEPLDCTNSKKGCDWIELGIGKKWIDRDDKNAVTNFYCCSKNAIALSFCDSSDYGRLVINGDIFKGKATAVKFTSLGEHGIDIKSAITHIMESGNQIVIMANCHPDGLDVYVSGSAKWKSVHGFLPADIYGSLPFFVGVTCLYFLLMMVYGAAVYKNREDGIEIQRWLIVTIAIGFLEVLFRTGDLFVWNATGYRENLFMYSGVLMGVLKRSISRSVILMLCLGWGIVRVDLGSDMKKIILFFLIYAILSGISDSLFTVALTSPQLSGTDEKNLLSLVEWIAVGVTGLNMLCYCWILESLSNTLLYLKNHNQDIKLRLYEKLRLCLILSALFAVMWTLIGFADVYVDQRLFGKEEEYLITCMWEMNYFFILIFVAKLFWPSRHAKRYAYVMELRSDPDEEEHDLDFTLGDDGDDDDDDGEFHKFNNEFDPDGSDDDDMGFEMGSRQNGLTLS